MDRFDIITEVSNIQKKELRKEPITYIIEVEKFNPYHDRLGRFAPAPQGVANSDSKLSGALSGAWTDENDPDHKERDRVAQDLYKQIRSHNRQSEIEAIAKHSGVSVEDAGRAYDHIFIREHNLGDRISRFDPDYYMAHSWNRIRHNKDIQPHDIIMLKHEIAEEKIMGKSLDILYKTAHEQAEKQYNYRKALKKYLKDHDV
ncbi:MAG: hypothetical protein Q4C56_03995 [Peptococcaceae bacterium]|nr:hypothetical protein [Peptococcaceae bacterium]